MGERKNDFPALPLSRAPVLILGLGNPLLGDDGVGWRVAAWVAEQNVNVPVDYHAGGGLALMERIIGYTAVIIIDAIQTGRAPTGTVHCFPLDELPHDIASHLASAHETTLTTALLVGRQMGADLPRRITIVGIEAQQVYDFSEELSPAVAQAVVPAGQLVCAQLRQLANPV